MERVTIKHLQQTATVINNRMGTSVDLFRVVACKWCDGTGTSRNKYKEGSNGCTACNGRGTENAINSDNYNIESGNGGYMLVVGGGSRNIFQCGYVTARTLRGLMYAFLDGIDAERERAASLSLIQRARRIQP